MIRRVGKKGHLGKVLTERRGKRMSSIKRGEVGGQ